MSIKERCRLNIQSVAFGGAGVGRADGLVIFVPFTAAGDIADIEIVERRKNFARGRLLGLVEPSPQRTEPLCRYFGRCGGCSYQHIAYHHQLKIKQAQVKEVFLKIGKVPDPPVEEVTASPRVYAYRGKAELHAAKSRKGFHLGFMDITGGRLVDIERCEIMHESINQQIIEARSQERFESRFRGTRVHSPQPAAIEQSSFHTSKACCEVVDQNGGDLIFWSKPNSHTGDAIVRTVKDREFLVPRSGFFQANLYLTDAMVDEVCRLAGLEKRASILDACCGSGLFSIFLAQSAERLTGVEIHEKSVQYARENAERNGIKNAEFICADIGEHLCRMAERQDAVDLILLDPPRAGMGPKALDAICRVQCNDIIYVSCNPATQARDVKYLTANGYVLQRLQPLDMFSQTGHMESIGLLRRK